MLRGRVWLASIIVFIASFCTLVIELVAGRILAPYIGVSLYTWTSIIGVCLAGISVGNYVGGRIADRRASTTVLGGLFVLASVASVGILLLTWLTMTSPLLAGMPLVPKILVSTSVIFFLPTFVLGTISPVVIKLTLSDLAHTGRIVGLIYAWSTVGSIFGTFATGFYLIELMGTRSIIWTVAGILLAMGIVIGGLWRTSVRAGGVALALAAFVGMYSDNARWAAPCWKETSYFCIRVTEQDLDGRQFRALILDHLIHSFSAIDNPRLLGYGYERVYAEMTDYLARGRPDFHSLSVGGGGYTFPRYLEVVYPEARIDVIEIDPGVTEASFEFMGLSRDTRIVSFNEDARQWFIRTRPERTYDIIYGDVYNDLAVPYHLTTIEYDAMIRRSLKDDGVYLATVIDNLHSGEFLRAFATTLRPHFENIYLLGLGTPWDGVGANTYVLAASPRPIDFDAFRSFVGPNSAAQKFTGVLNEGRFQEYLARGRQITLTDDYAPVDNLAAPLFVERGY